MKHLRIASLLLVFILALGCNKDDDSSHTPTGQDPNTFVENFGNEITRNFLGTVVDKNRNPIENVIITIGNLTAQTDSNGIFIIQNAPVYERFGYVKAEKAGYISGSRAVVPSSGTNKVTIMLLDATVVGTTNSGTAETIALTNGASLALGGDYITEDGFDYSGPVNVMMHHLDPTDEDMADQMPGMLYAANANNEEQMLITYGMLAVELRGSAGEYLNLAEGTTAEITMPLDETLLADAPSSIPLWYFDETHGYWVEEGEATLVGNAYAGTVSHFSFWNCDIPTDAVNLCLTVTNDEGNPLANLWVEISSPIYGTRGNYTNENGEVCGLIPANEILYVSIYSWHHCETLIISESAIGPFTSDASNTIVLNSNTQNLSGNFINCDGNPVDNGVLRIIIGDQIYFESINDGYFNISFDLCDNVDFYTIEAIDLYNSQSSGLITYYYETASTNIGTIRACEDVVEYIEYIVDDIFTQTFNSPMYVEFKEDFLADGSFFLIQSQTDSCFFMEGILPPHPPFVGSYDSDSLPFNFYVSECFDISDTNNNINYNLVNLGEVGDYVDINFSGDYEDNAGNPHTISGVIHVLRDY
ncbi:carboxypeptidase-like regulatory domain-containing protein [Lacinutrix iliipiscaria]|uniref:Carboxypeptidase-like regulatory domain-containing protein n=1 Tax=Lacinutrix iliipiscaria TaxID=1230532 RepID=A0ABW5WJS2_9FLAO